MGGLGNTLPPTIAILGAIGLFCLGWVLNASITIERIKEALQSNAGILFDPQIVTGLTQLNEQDALRGLVQ